MERYNKQTVILQTDEGMAHDKNCLIEVWKLRIKDHFKHYKLISVKLDKDKGKEKL